jgi:hypothetical protein
MRTSLVVLVLLFGLYTDRHAHRLAAQEAEKRLIYHSTLRAAHHVVNNFLNQVQLFRLEAERLPDFDPELLALYGQVVEEAAVQLRQLERVTELTEENILNAAMQPRSAEVGG